MVRSEDSEPIPLGVRFHPTDDELLNYYLKFKTHGLDSKVGAIPEVDVYKHDAWDLPNVFRHHFRSTFPNCSKILANDHQWYFFCRQDGKNRAARSTKAGFWKVTGPDRKIESRDTDTEIGTKRTVGFHTGRVRDSNSKGTDWVIHEYHLTPDPLNPPKKGFVLCLLMKNKKKNKNKNDNTRSEVEPSSVNGSSPDNNFTPPIPNTNHWASDVENWVSEDSIEELSPEDQEILWQCLSEPTNQQPQMHQEPGFSDMDFIYYNGSSNNDYEEMQVHGNTTESNDDIGQYFVGEDGYTLAESRGHRAMAARRSEMPETHLVSVSSDCSLTKEIVKDSESSSETDTGVLLNSRVDPIVETFISLNRMWRRENSGFLDDESEGSSASSVNSIADKPIEIDNCQLISPEFPVKNTRTRRPQNELRSHNFVAQGTPPGKLCVQEVLHKEPKQGKVRESICITVKDEGSPDSIKAKVTATKLPQKEKSIVVSNSGLGMAGGNNTKLSLKSREQEESSGRNQKGVRNFGETSLARSHGSSSPFDYAFNLVLGTILLVLFFVFVGLDVIHRISSVFN